MIEILPVNVKNILAVKASGKLTDEDYQTFLPELEKLIRESGCISLYVELEDFQGWEAKAAWDDLKFGLQNNRHFHRIAIVGDNALLHTGVLLSNLFVHGEVKFFDKEHADAAWDWVSENPEQQKKQRASQPYQRILLATDFSEPAELAAARAIELAKHYNASIDVLHCVEDMLFYNEWADPLMVDLPINETAMKDLAEAQMQKFAERTGLLSQGAKLEVQWGNPKWCIVSRARELSADLIIMGSHGHRGLERLLGSVSSGVTHQAHCDVLLVKA